jgi:hypothetical protein
MRASEAWRALIFCNRREVEDGTRLNGVDSLHNRDLSQNLTCIISMYVLVGKPTNWSGEPIPSERVGRAF